MGRLLADFIRDESGYPYRVYTADKVVNTFTASGTGSNTFTPPTTGDRVVITSILMSTDTTAEITVAGSISDPITFYINGNDSVSPYISPHAPIIGEIGEEFSTTCTFTGAATGNSMSAIVGYVEGSQSYSG